MLLRSLQRILFYPTVWTIAFGWAILFTAGTSFAGEKIRFSDETENAASPNRQPQLDFSRPFERKQSGPAGGIDVGPLPPPATSGKVRDPKIEESIDQKKNWIFVTPTDSDTTLKEMFNIREYKFDEFGGGKKSKSAIDRYFERKAEDHREISEKLNSRARDREPGEEDDAAENSSIGGLPLELGTKSSISPSSDLDPNAWGRRGPQMGNPMSASPGDLSPRNFNSAEVLGFSRRGFGGGPSQFFGREQRMDEFQKTLGLAGPAKPTVLIDPINLQNDATRQPLNPILGTGSRGIGIGSGLSSGLSSVGGGAGAPTSPSPISELINARPASGSSLSPAISAPPSAAFFQPRPAVLEIPRRKF